MLIATAKLVNTSLVCSGTRLQLVVAGGEAVLPVLPSVSEDSIDDNFINLMKTENGNIYVKTKSNLIQNYM